MQYKKAEVAQRIVNAATKEFERVGYYRASIMKIATDAKVTIGNLYRYFKGKESLFEHIVGKAYNEIPRIIIEYYTLNFNLVDSEEAILNIAKGIANSYGKYGRELMILVDKSEGSKFDSFGQAIRASIVQMCQLGIYRNQGEDNQLIAEIIADNFITGLFTIFRKVSDDDRIKQIKKLIKFYFYDTERRI